MLLSQSGSSLVRAGTLRAGIHSLRASGRTITTRNTLATLPKSNSPMTSLNRTGKFGVRHASVAAGLGRGAAKIRQSASTLGYAAFVIGGVALFATTAWYFVDEMLLPSSDIQVFQRAFSLVDKDPKVHEILGPNLKAHGEQGHNRWAHTRQVAAKRNIDGAGREHVVMQFHVDGDKASGLVRLEAVAAGYEKSNGFRYIVLEVPGEKRHYIVNEAGKTHKPRGLFGIRWGPKHD